MKNCIYFAAEEDIFPDGPRVALGFGFDRAGRWRPRPAPRAEVLAVDDRFPPAREGLEEALRFLRTWPGEILWDLERAPTPALLGLIRETGRADSAVPPAWVGAPHGAVLVGPYRPGISFGRWLGRQSARFGAPILDAAPIRHYAEPGSTPLPWEKDPPGCGSLCPGAICLCARCGSGFCYWDTRETLRRRCAAAGIPAVILVREWLALED